MIINLVRCFSCGAMVPDTRGPTHAYMASSPGCWHVYGEILARQFSDPAFRDLQRLTADTYAIQHSGRPSPVSTQSVCGHLMSLCVVLERHAPYHDADQVLQAAVQGKIRFWWLTPPRSLGEITVVDVRAAASANEHRERVQEWARSAWLAWAEHHDTVRTWVARVCTH
jgi:hypothetical protein